MKILSLLSLISLTIATDTETERLVNSPGHLKPIGFGRPVHDAESFDGFPHVRWFFENHVHDLKPLIMKNAAKLSPAFTKWTDDYFLNQDEPDDHVVSVELKKKENRTFGVEELSFKQFVSTYNNSDIYMVNAVPPFIAGDVVIPGPLQCDDMIDTLLVDNVMWYSSGGTKSVVHTDSVDNINCLYRGRKELLFVDPDKYPGKVDLDHPEGAYSDIDVDRVDFTKYPGMADVEYLSVTMEPGDCLYIPYKWFHQVRSFGSNVAVNIWWDHHAGKETDLGLCEDGFDPELTLDKVLDKFIGFGGAEMSINEIRSQFSESTRISPADLDKTISILLGRTDEIEELDPKKQYKQIMRDIFLVLDANRNNKIEHEEVQDAPDEAWDDIMELMMDFDNLYSVLEKQYHQNHRDEL